MAAWMMMRMRCDLHEYGHAINDDICRLGRRRYRRHRRGVWRLLGRILQLRTANGTNFHPEWAFTWDGHSADTWAGRFLNKTNYTYDHSHYYTDHETIGGEANYSDQLWGTPIFQASLNCVGWGAARGD
jgi:hypothetical protein